MIQVNWTYVILAAVVAAFALYRWMINVGKRNKRQTMVWMAITPSIAEAAQGKSSDETKSRALAAFNEQPGFQLSTFRADARSLIYSAMRKGRLPAYIGQPYLEAIAAFESQMLVDQATAEVGQTA